MAPNSNPSEQRPESGAIQPVQAPARNPMDEPIQDPVRDRIPEPAQEPLREPAPSLAFSAWRLVGALLIAGASDLIGGGIDATVAGVPATIPLDILTALALWAILGRPVILLVALIAEALPGVGVLPLWTAVVIAIAVTGGIPGRALR
jgi:hypothetical protein